MAVTGPPQWHAGQGVHLASGGLSFVNGLLALGRADGDVLGIVLGSFLMAGAVFIVAVAPARRVLTDDAGIHVRRWSWRTTSVAWDDVADIRPRRPDQPGDPLVVVTRDGREIRTMLNPTDHRTLPRYWRARAGLPEPT